MVLDSRNNSTPPLSRVKRYTHVSCTQTYRCEGSRSVVRDRRSRVKAR